MRLIFAAPKLTVACAVTALTLFAAGQLNGGLPSGPVFTIIGVLAALIAVLEIVMVASSTVYTETETLEAWSYGAKTRRQMMTQKW